MYSASNVAVDKGLGFDFSEIANLVKAAIPVTLGVYSNQMQLKQIKAMQQSGIQNGYGLNPYGPLGQQGSQLPLAMSWGQQPTFGNQSYVQPSSEMSTTTMALIGAASLVVGLIAFKALK